MEQFFSMLNKSNMSWVIIAVTHETNFCQREFPIGNKISNQLCLYIYVIVILVGLLGNFINILVFSSKPLRKHSSNIYILLLSISDSTHLIAALFYWLTGLKCLQYPHSSIDILNHSDNLCKLVLFFLHL